MNSGYNICTTQTVSKAKYIYCIFFIEVNQVASVSQSSWEFSESLGKRSVRYQNQSKLLEPERLKLDDKRGSGFLFRLYDLTICH